MAWWFVERIATYYNLKVGISDKVRIYIILVSVDKEINYFMSNQLNHNLNVFFLTQLIFNPLIQYYYIVLIFLNYK